MLLTVEDVILDILDDDNEAAWTAVIAASKERTYKAADQQMWKTLASLANENLWQEWDGCYDLFSDRSIFRRRVGITTLRAATLRDHLPEDAVNTILAPWAKAFGHNVY